MSCTRSLSSSKKSIRCRRCFVVQAEKHIVSDLPNNGAYADRVRGAKYVGD